MIERTPDQSAIDAAENLTGMLSGVRAELKRLNRYGIRNRRLIWLSIVSIALDLTLTILLVFAYGTARNSQVEAKDARNVAAVQHQSLLYACKLGNQSRAQQVQLWEHLAAISKPPPHLTERQLAKNRRQIGQLLAYIRADFRPRPCKAIYKLP